MCKAPCPCCRISELIKDKTIAERIDEHCYSGRSGRHQQLPQLGHRAQVSQILQYVHEHFGIGTGQMPTGPAQTAARSPAPWREGGRRGS